MKIFFSVGEPSGDLHGANLIRQLQKQHPAIECVGYGGPKMAAAGCDLHEDLTALSVMWLIRVIANIDKFWKLLVRADRFFRYERPDAVILIDYPGFNWWIAWRAKAYGIPVYYYGTPQIWAWARWRVFRMRRYIDHAFCKLPFEQDWLRERGCAATFVGHPYFDQLTQQKLDEQFVVSNHREEHLVTILPGSRTQEVQQNLHWLLKSAQRVHQKCPRARFAIAAYNDKLAKIATEMVRETDLPVEIRVGKTPELMKLATCCMACSGSVSLELLYNTTPTVILYHVGWLPYQIQKVFRKVKYITLVNLLAADDPFDSDISPYDPTAPGAEKVLFPEYLTCEDKSAEIAEHVIEWLTDDVARTKRIEQLAALKEECCAPGASKRATEQILKMLGCTKQPLAA